MRICSFQICGKCDMMLRAEHAEQEQNAQSFTSFGAERETWVERKVRNSLVALFEADCVENVDLSDGSLRCRFYFALGS